MLGILSQRRACAPIVTVWALDVSAVSPDQAVTGFAFSFPTLVPTNANEAYIGLAFWAFGNFSGGGTSGYTFSHPIGASTNYYCYNNAISASTSPTALNTNNGSDNCGTLAALFYFPGRSITVAGSASNSGTGLNTLSITAHNVGDLMVVAISMGSETAVTGVSGGGVAAWNRGPHTTTSSNGGQAGEIWYGVVTTAGAATVTVSPTPTGYSSIVEIELAHS